MSSPKLPERLNLSGNLVAFLISATVAALVLFILVANIGGGGLRPMPKPDRALSEIKSISTALESYKVDYGDYPTNSLAGSKGSAVLFKALVISNSASNPSGKVYFEPNKSIVSSTNLVAGAYFIDPFGAPYEYRYDPRTNGANHGGPGNFDLWSHGGSREKRTNDVPENWKYWLKTW